MTTFQHATVHGLKIFYREAGSKASPTIVLLHGFPNSSHMFRDLIPQLAGKFHVIAPDYVGFGYSDAPDAGKFNYTREEFEDAKAAVYGRIYEIEEKLRALDSNRARASSFVHFAELQLTNMATVWRIASPEQRERVQNLLFEGGLDYSPEKGFLNRSKSSLFRVLETVDIQKANLVDLIGIEPMTSSMPWKRAIGVLLTVKDL